MLLLRKPSPQAIQRYLEDQRSAEFSYLAVGATNANPPEDFVLDHTRVKLGGGEQVFLTARSAMERWEQFRLGWVEAFSSETPIESGKVVAIIAHTAGFWWLNPCRIVYVIADSEPIRRYGFAYGTLDDHVESGEERFLIEWDNSDNSVWYDILAFSRPRHVLARLAYPLARRIQKRFARDSAAAMKRAVDPDTIGV